MTVENYIESQYRSLAGKINIEYIDLYKTFSSRKLQELFSSIQHIFAENYSAMNSRLPTGEYTAHFWAENSRNLVQAIEVLQGLERVLKETPDAFETDSYYKEIIEKSLSFLSKSGGSQIPQHMEKVEIYYTEPIVKKKTSVRIHSSDEKNVYAELKNIGEGSYATVYTYKDTFYNRKFVLKRAKKDLSEKELERFKQEFEQMDKLSSPYIVDVFRFNEEKNEYIMEYMDYTLLKYYEKYNSTITVDTRKSIAYQILRAFRYIHSKGLLHRDISPNNILLKIYDDVLVVKISDFGLVKVPDNTLTSFNTDFKGWFNDPALQTEGFYNYSMKHETYAITRLIFYIMEGRTNTDKIKDEKLKLFVNKGLSADKSQRFANVNEIESAFKQLFV